MIILNTGLPKSATTLLFEYQSDLVKELTEPNGFEEFRTQNKSRFVQNLDERIYQMIIDIHEEYGNLVIKIHKPPDYYMKKLVEKDGAKVTCCYRDPRDIVLSALDHGVKSRNGLFKSGAFGNLFTAQDVIVEFKDWVNIFYEWREYGHAMMIQYETFIENKVTLLLKMIKYLNIELPIETVLKIYEKKEKEKESKPIFNKGTCYRWKSEMSQEDIDKCNSLLYEEIYKMGYAV